MVKKLTLSRAGLVHESIGSIRYGDVRVVEREEHIYNTRRGRAVITMLVGGY